MSLFWNKRVESDKVIYTRTKGQKRLFYLLMSIGLLMMIGLPIFGFLLMTGLPITQRLPALFLSLIFLGGPLLGAALIVFVAIFISTVNFKLANAKRKNKKFQIISTNEGDTVEIER